MLLARIHHNNAVSVRGTESPALDSPGQIKDRWAKRPSWPISDKWAKLRCLLEDPRLREAKHLQPSGGGGSFVGKGSHDNAFNAPALLQPGEARERRPFPVKPHDYGGGVLLDGAATGIKGASPPGSRRVVWR
jgi:hypothetical protein